MNCIRQNIFAVALITPLAVYFVLAAVIPHQRVDPGLGEASIDPTGYLLLVVARVLVIAAVLAVCWQRYIAKFPLQIDRWGWIVGITGGVLWIAICSLSLERTFVTSLGVSESILGTRSSIDPLAAYPGAETLALFLVFRFALLVIIVPIAEELFLRGFLMRIVDSDDWAEQPLDQIGWAGLLCGTIYGVLSHPGEFVAAAVWFSLVTLLMVRTGRFWNCVLAHAVTNLMLGVYVCIWGRWSLW